MKINKKLIIGIVAAILLIIGVVLTIKEVSSYKDVSIIFSKADIIVDIYTEDDNKVTTVSDSRVVSLKQGNYYYVVTGEKFDNERVNFGVSEDTSVTVVAMYSQESLDNLLKDARSSIQRVLLARYPNLTQGYIIGDEKLHEYGEWYSAKLIQRVSGGNQPDVYRTILKNDGNSWKIAVSPRLSISISEFPDVSKVAIRSVNGALSNEAYSLLYR